MADNDQDKLLDHEYDGIQELDNNLPLWWLWTFFGAIIFSFIYWIHYSFVGDGPSLDEELNRSMAKIEQQRKQAQSGDSKVEEMSEEKVLAMGKKIYNANCAACHMESGAGSVGPNLTDDYWIHDPSVESITKLVQNGVLDKGMPPWQGILRPHEIDAVVAYVDKEIKGTQVVGGKAPQGEKVN